VAAAGGGGATRPRGGSRNVPTARRQCRASHFEYVSWSELAWAKRQGAVSRTICESGGGGGLVVVRRGHRGKCTPLSNGVVVEADPRNGCANTRTVGRASEVPRWRWRMKEGPGPEPVLREASQVPNSRWRASGVWRREVAVVVICKSGRSSSGGPWDAIDGSRRPRDSLRKSKAGYVMHSKPPLQMRCDVTACRLDHRAKA
jgi:hypothetical protein